MPGIASVFTIIVITLYYYYYDRFIPKGFLYK